MTTDAETHLTPEQRVNEHLRLLGREMGEMSRSVARSIEMHPTQLQAVDQLLRNGPLSPGELSQALGLTSGATTTLVDHLVEMGHVRRSAHDHDRRRVVLTPTDHARTEARAAFRPLRGTFEMLTDGYTAAELEVIDRFLQDLRHAVRAYAAERAACAPSNRRRSKRGADGP